MIPLLWSALALSSAASDSAARDWLSLDRDIESLASALAPEAAQGAEVSAWLKSAYRNSPDIQVGGNDEGGFQIQGARINVKGKIGDWEFRASVDAAAGPTVVRDFYTRWPLLEGIHAQMGNFKSPFLFSSVASDERDIFFDRSTQGALWSGREPGFQVDGQQGPFGWFAAVHNGGDAQGTDVLFAAKGMFSIVGDPIPMKQAGGYGVDSPTRLQAGLAYVDDGAAQSGNAAAIAVELTALSGPLFGHVEFIDYDDGFVDDGSIASGNAKKAAEADVADTSPWGVTGGYMLTSKDEFSLRYEDLDDDDDTTKAWAGYTRYQEGHAAKWQVNFVSKSSDAGDVDELIVGLTVVI